MESLKQSCSQKMSSLYIWLCGVCMGVADLIPGISGGTIAFILGFYTPLLESIKSIDSEAIQLLAKGKFKDFASRVHWRFLVSLLLGIAFAFLCFAKALHFIFEHPTYRTYLYAAFCGLVLASFIYCVKQIKKYNFCVFISIFFGCTLAFYLTESSFVQNIDKKFAVEINLKDKLVDFREVVTNYEPQKQLLTQLSFQSLSGLLFQGVLNENTPIYDNQHLLVGLAGDLVIPSSNSFFNGWLIFCGSLAVCALILPGISGSYILTLLGVYPLVMEALVDVSNGLMHGSIPSEPLATLGSLALGIVIGALAFSRFLSWLLARFHDVTIAALSGFMIGALKSIWPFWTYEYALVPLKLSKGPQLVIVDPYLPSWDSPYLLPSICFAITGFLLVFAIEYFAKKQKLKS